MTRIAIIGDVGGHNRDLHRVLRQLGADPDLGLLPPGLTVVQVGDLVDRGPDSAGVVQTVARFVANHPDRWMQLFGNHDYAYTRIGGSLSRSPLDHASVEMLKTLDERNQLRVAAAVELDSIGPTLLTHAGLAPVAWRAIGAPSDAAEAADILNGGGARAVVEAMGRDGDTYAGPLWVEVDSLRESWKQHDRTGGEVPFAQIHGHSFAFEEWDVIGGRLFRSVDYALGKNMGTRLRPVVYTGRVLERPAPDRSRSLS